MAAAAVVLAGCGSSGAASSSSSTAAKTPTHQSAKALFVSAGCAGCHTLAAANATGSVGPDLDQLKPSYQAVVKQVTNGGGVMPSFSGTLSKTQIDALAHFVAASTGGGS